MDEITIKVRDNGPYLVSGRVELVDAEGNRFETKQRFSLCRCGGSKRKPFCDGTHNRIDFEDRTRAE